MCGARHKGVVATCEPRFINDFPHRPQGDRVDPAELRAVQLLAKKADVWDEGIEQLFKELQTNSCL